MTSRDLRGYGEHPPNPQWPNRARIAVQLVLNYEEGGENCILNGDPHSESYLWEVVGTPPLHGVRNMNIESVYEYGSRAGVWRILPNSRRIFAEEGGFLYNSDVYNDDLPYWEQHGNQSLLLIPYTLENNDMKFATAQGFNQGEDFFQYLKTAFDVLYAEGEYAPKMMSVGLHCRLVGRPGRFGALQRFIDYVQSHSEVWFCRRIDIARHWHTHHTVNFS